MIPSSDLLSSRVRVTKGPHKGTAGKVIAMWRGRTWVVKIELDNPQKNTNALVVRRSWIKPIEMGVD